MADTPTILVVDDHEINRIVLGEILKRQGYSVVEASDGPAARAIAASLPVDLILLDVMMPGEQGFETCRKLKSTPETADVPIIFISALATVENKLEGLDSGAVDYITKPFHAVEVAARVRLHLKLSRAANQLAALQAQRLTELGNAQRAMLSDPATLPEARFAVRQRQAAEAGGDYYEVLPVGPERYSYILADVSGNGVRASLTTAALKALTAQNVTQVNTPLESLKIINSVLNRILTGGNHITACMALVNRDNMTVEALCAGHPPMVRLPVGGTPELLGNPGEPLGVFPTLLLKPQRIRCKPGERLFLYTDGVIEGEGRSRSSGEKILLDQVENARNLPLDEATGAIFNHMARENDDATLMGIEL